jgi:hypothetical protein
MGAGNNKQAVTADVASYASAVGRIRLYVNFMPERVPGRLTEKP